MSGDSDQTKNTYVRRHRPSLPPSTAPAPTRNVKQQKLLRHTEHTRRAAAAKGMVGCPSPVYLSIIEQQTLRMKTRSAMDDGENPHGFIPVHHVRGKKSNVFFRDSQYCKRIWITFPSEINLSPSLHLKPPHPIPHPICVAPCFGDKSIDRCIGAPRPGLPGLQRGTGPKGEMIQIDSPASAIPPPSLYPFLSLPLCPSPSVSRASLSTTLPGILERCWGT